MPFIRYNDFWFRVIACALAAHFIVMFGVRVSFFEALVKGHYHIPMLSSFLIAFLLMSYVRYACVRLDRLYDWRAHTLQRIGLQLFFGLVIPAVLAFAMAYVYFLARGVSILATSYLRFDYPVIILLLVLLNAYYLLYYVFSRLTQAEQLVPNAAVTAMEGEPERKAFLVARGARSIPIPVDEIAYFHRNGQNYLRTASGDDYYITQSLDDVEAQLPVTDFFRVNRQMLVSRKACRQINPIQHYKLELITEPGYKEQVVISQKKNREFKEWIKGK